MLGLAMVAAVVDATSFPEPLWNTLFSAEPISVWAPRGGKMDRVRHLPPRLLTVVFVAAFVTAGWGGLPQLRQTWPVRCPPESQQTS